jgi:UDP-glucuronate 4-epimerase
MTERFLVTGALGCLGAWTATLLVREGTSVVAFDIGDDDHRLRLVATPEEVAGITFARGDVTDLEQLEQTLAAHGITHVVHFAALQVPSCRTDPPFGARVNVLGTVNVFEAAARHGLSTPVAYASSAAVYDTHGEIAPQTLYGVYKVANEGTARIYWADRQVPSIGIRPFTVFGPGRDQGITSGPTTAMLAAARREAYEIPFGGETELHYAPDVARGFIKAARSRAEGARIYDFPGTRVHIRDVVRTIVSAAPEADGLVSFVDEPLPFPPELPGQRLDAAWTPFEDAVRETIEHFRRAAGTAA